MRAIDEWAHEGGMCEGAHFMLHCVVHCGCICTHGMRVSVCVCVFVCARMGEGEWGTGGINKGFEAELAVMYCIDKLITFGGESRIRPDKRVALEAVVALGKGAYVNAQVGTIVMDRRRVVCGTLAVNEELCRPHKHNTSTAAVDGPCLGHQVVAVESCNVCAGALRAPLLDVRNAKRSTSG